MRILTSAPQNYTEAGCLSFIQLHLISHVNLKYLSNKTNQPMADMSMSKYIMGEQNTFVYLYLFTNRPLLSTGHVFMFWV